MNHRNPIRSTLAGLALCGGLVASASAAEADRGTIRARVAGFRNSEGVLACLLFARGDGWPGDVKKAFAKTKAPIEGSEAAAPGMCVFENVPQGEYAVAVMHDEDENGKMKQNFIGVPQEGYGASNNPDNGFMSGPPFDKSTFELTEAEQTLSIQLRY